MGELLTGVKNIIFFMIIITIISNLYGKSSFKQYISVFSGMILILIVIRPVLQWLSLDGKLDYFFQQRQYQVSVEDVSGRALEAEEQQKQRIVAEYKEEIKRQIDIVVSAHNLCIDKADIKMIEDSNEERCGEILGMNLVLKTRVEIAEDGTIEERDVNEIDQIIIDKIEINEENLTKDKEQVTIDSVLQMTVRKELSVYFRLPIEKVQVKINE